jgi:hypothetical protein
MRLVNRLEKVERRVGIVAVSDAPCPTCEPLWRALVREYGDFPTWTHSPAVCAELHRNLEKA